MYGHFINPIINETSDLIDDLGFITMRDYYTTYSDMKQNDNMYITSLPEGYNITDIIIDVIEPFVDNETSIDWDEAELSDTSEKWWSVCCSDDIFVATAGNTNSFMYSYDGMTWNEGTISSGTHNWYSVCYGNGRFISVASDGYSAYSTDGIRWTEGKISNAARYWRKVIYGDDMFIASADNSYFAYSTDGKNWTETRLANDDKRYEAICYGNDRYIAIAQNTNSFNYSESHKNQNFAIITNTGETLIHKDWLDVSNANIYENDVYYHVTGIPKEIILNHNLRSCSSGRMRLLFKLIKE